MRKIKFTDNKYTILQYNEVDLVEQLNKEYLDELNKVGIYPSMERKYSGYVVLQGNKLYFYLPPANSEWYITVLGLIVKWFKEFPEWKFRIDHYEDKLAGRDFYICAILTPLT